MPPEDNKLKIGIDPVFKGNPNPAAQNPAASASAYNVLTNQAYTPTFNANGNIVNPNEQISGPITAKSIVRTYKNDIASAIQTDHVSSINIAIAESEKMRKSITGEPIITPSDYSKTRVVIFGSVIIIIIAIIIIGLTYFLGRPNNTTTRTNSSFATLLTVEYSEELNTSNIVPGKFVSALSSKLNDIQIPVNMLYSPIITSGGTTTKKLTTASEFIALASFNMPDLVRRTLKPEYMVGMYSFGSDLPFIIFKTTSFENSYAGMLAWEKDLESNVGTLFRLNNNLDKTSLALALTPTTNLKFTDGVILNKDVRLLRNTANEIILLYGILDKETIIITVSDTAFKEIIDRLNKERGLKR